MTELYAEEITHWYQKHIQPEELDKKIEATLEYVKRFNQPEDGEWNIWAYEIVDGHHGQYTVRIFLEQVLNEPWMEEEDLDKIMGTFDGVSHALADVFNAHTNLSGTFWVGHNEADGSLGVFYSIRA